MRGPLKSLSTPARDSWFDQSRGTRGATEPKVHAWTRWPPRPLIGGSPELETRGWEEMLHASDRRTPSGGRAAPSDPQDGADEIDEMEEAWRQVGPPAKRQGYASASGAPLSLYPAHPLWWPQGCLTRRARPSLTTPRRAP